MFIAASFVVNLLIGFLLLIVRATSNQIREINSSLVAKYGGVRLATSFLVSVIRIH